MIIPIHKVWSLCKRIPVEKKRFLKSDLFYKVVSLKKIVII